MAQQPENNSTPEIIRDKVDAIVNRVETSIRRAIELIADPKTSIADAESQRDKDLDQLPRDAKDSSDQARREFARKLGAPEPIDLVAQKGYRTTLGYAQTVRKWFGVAGPLGKVVLVGLFFGAIVYATGVLDTKEVPLQASALDKSLEQSPMQSRERFERLQAEKQARLYFQQFQLQRTEKPKQSSTRSYGAAPAPGPLATAELPKAEPYVEPAKAERAAPPSEPVQGSCKTCDGSGWRVIQQRGLWSTQRIRQRCPACNGGVR
ncbi:MAG: hypothetical protein ACREJD_08475 [Phycisphaerales bacterium]